MTRADDTANERPPGHDANDAREARARTADQAAGAEGVDDGPDQPPRVGYIGKRLGRFHILAELGRGGMATVYRAHDPHVGRDVAVKVMHGFFAGRADIEARFRREANAVAAIKHPSILALYDFTPPVGEEPGYIVSEIIDGPGLRTLVEMRGGRLLPEVASAIVVRVAEALGAAHAAGIVHRDVKPDNVMIDRAGGGVRVVLTDFGVAHVGTLDTMTATGAVLGSPAFMSPEQARGDDVGPQSDVFSLGVLLYQLVTGHLPFAGKDPLALITAILRGEFTRPGKLEARVGPDLEQIILRCLRREPAERFADGHAVAVTLREILTAAGFPDEEALLRRALPDLDAFSRELAPEIAQRAVAAAEAARKRGQIPRALAEVGRALAYVPEHTVARALLARLGSRHRSPLVVGGAGLAVAAIAGMVVVGALRRAPPGGTLPPPAGAAAARSTPLPATTTAPAGGAAAPGVETLPERAAAVPATLTPPGADAPANRGPAVRPAPAPAPRPRARVARGPGVTTPARAATATAADSAPAAVVASPGAPGATTSPDSAPSEATAPKSAHEESSAASNTTSGAAAAPATASVVLRASQGFCEPSLDGFAPSLRASYHNLAPGPHEIYCTLPQGGGKVRVATYQLRAGTRPSLIILRGPDGRPVLGRPE